MGCHFLLQCMKVKSESEVTQSCPTLSNPMDCSLPGSSVHGIFQAATEEEKTFAGRLTHEDLYMGNKYMKICLSSLVIREMQIKTTMGYNYIALQSVSQSVSSVTQSCPTLCDPMNCSMPGLPIHHQLPEFTQTHVHRVSDAIQPSHPLSSPSPPAPNPSQHQSL